MNQQNYSCNCGRNTTGCGSCTQNQWVRRPWNTRNTCGTCSQNSRVGNTRNCGTCAQNRSTCGCNALTGATVWRRNCSCNQTYAEARTSCPCGQTRTEARDDCSCGEHHHGIESRNTNWDCTECNRGAGYEPCLSDKSLAMVYSPHQKFHELYDPRQGLCNGTVFCELNKPFLGYGRGK